MLSSVREREKYDRIWREDGYAEVSPGAGYVPLFLKIAGPAGHVIDVGAGKGAASRLLADAGLMVTGFDLTDAAWDHDDIPLKTGSVWQGLGVQADYAFCCDMMEHLPTEYVALAVARILEAAPKAFFSISFNPDGFGAFIQDTLHLTVRPFEWWLEVFNEVGTVLEARDLLGEGVFYVGR